MISQNTEIKRFLPDTGNIAVSRTGSSSSIFYPRDGLSGAPLWNPDTYVPSKIIQEPSLIDEVLAWSRETGTGYPKEKCGYYTPRAGNGHSIQVAACNRKPGEHKPIPMRSTCGRRECPECWDTWAIRAAKRITDRLNGYMSARFGFVQQSLPGKALRRLRPRHFAFSVSRAWVSALLDKMYRDGVQPPEFQIEFWRRAMPHYKDLVRRSGLSAAVIIPHDIRLKKDPVGADRQNDINRYREVLDREDWRDRVVFSPHFHVIGFGAICDSVKFYEETDCIIQLIRIVDTPERLIKYLLSHAPDIAGKCSYVYVGGLSYRCLEHVTEFKRRIPIPCKECIEEGRKEEETARVIASADPDTFVYEKEKGKRKRTLTKWSFENISNKIYFRTQSRSLFRIVRPGEPRKPKKKFKDLFTRHGSPGHRKVRRVSYDDWDLLLEKKIIPGSWFDEDPPGDTS